MTGRVVEQSQGSLYQLSGRAELSISRPVTEAQQFIKPKDSSSGHTGKGQEGREERDKYGTLQNREDRDEFSRQGIEG